MSITSIIESAKLANNKRLLSYAMNEAQKRAAEKAVARNLMTKYQMQVPGFGYITAYQL